MKAKIFILSWVSYTDEDDYLYSDVKTFTDEKEAREQFGKDCGDAYDECEWGSQWDEPEDQRDEDCKYDVDESRDDNCYTVASSAYNGYKVEVSIVEKEIDVPFACDRRKYGMTLNELRDKIADFTGDKKREAMRKAKIFASHISLRHVSDVVVIGYGQFSDGHGNYYGENRDTLHFRWTDLEGDSNQFSIIE